MIGALTVTGALPVNRTGQQALVIGFNWCRGDVHKHTGDAVLGQIKNTSRGILYIFRYRKYYFRKESIVEKV